MEYYSATKKEEVLTDTWNDMDDLQNIMLHERNQTQKVHTVWFHLHEILEQAKLA